MAKILFSDEQPNSIINTVLLDKDNPTNGDVIKAMFPHHDIEVNEQKNYVQVFYDRFYTTYPLRWWLEPYKKGDDTDGKSD